ALVLQQPGMLGRRLLGRQRRQVGEDVVLLRDAQRLANGGEIMHRHGEGAVHVEHPVAHAAKAHAQSWRWRIKPSWHDEATNWPARLKILPRAKPRALPAQ